MGKATATLSLGAVLKGGSKAVFKAVSAGLKDISKELTKTAKDLYAMGKTDAADALGHTSMAIGRVAEGYKDLAKEGKKTAKTNKDVGDSFKDIGKQVTIVQDVWKGFEKSSNKTLESTKANVKYTKNLSNGLGELSAGLSRAGQNGDEWLKSLTKSNYAQADANKVFTKTGRVLNDLNTEQLKALGMNKSYRAAYREMQAGQSLYNKALGKSAGRSAEYRRSLEALGKTQGKTNEKFSAWSSTFNKVDNSLRQATLSSKGLDKSTRKSIETAKLSSITQQVLAGNIKTTASGFQILNERGLRPFKKLGYEAAKSAGLISKGFAQLSVKEGSKSLTEFGKALNESKGRSTKFRRELKNLSQSGLGVGKAFKTRADDMKKSDDIWRKHVATLQQAGKITTEMSHKMINGFNASKVASKDLAAAIPASEKRVQSFAKVIANVHQETGQSVKSLKKLANSYYKQSDSSLKSAERMELVKSKLQAQIPLHRNLVKAQQKLEEVEKNRASISKESISNIEATSKAIIGKTSSEKELLKQTNKAYDAQKKLLKSDTKVAQNRQKAADAIRKLRMEYGEAAKGNKDFRKSLQEIGTAYKNNNKVGGEVAVKNARKMGQELYKASKHASLFGRAMDSLNSHLKSFASYAAAASIIAGFVQTLRAGAGAVIDFDQSLRDLQAITGATEREVGLMGDKILEVASKTKFSAQEVAAGMKTLGQAGFSAQESIETMQAVSDLATGTLSDMSTAVDLVTTAMRVFDISAADSGHVADVFANAINKSKLTVEKLRVAFNYVGPVAYKAGASFEEVASSMMVLANSGIRASTIGTGLRQVFLKLVKPTDSLKSAVEEAGLSMDDLNPKTNSMRDIIANLSEVVVTAEDAFRMFGLRGASAISALTTSGTTGFDKMFEAVNRSGSAAQMAEIQMKGLGVRIKNMFDKAKNLAIILGESHLTAAFHAVIMSARLLLDGLIALSKSGFGKLVIEVTLAITAFIALNAILKSLASIGFIKVFFTTLIGGFTTLTGAVNGTTASIYGMNVAATAGVGVLGRLRLMVVALFATIANNPIGIWIVAIGSLLAIIYKLSTAMEKRLADIQKELDAAKTLADTYGKQADAMAELQIKLVEFGEGSEKSTQALKNMRKNLLETAAGEGELADEALLAAQAIDPLTGHLLKGGEALKAYRIEAERLKALQLGEALAAAQNKLNEAMESSHGFRDQTDASDLVSLYQEGRITFEQFTDTVDSWGGSLTKTQIAIQNSLTGLRAEAALAVTELRRMEDLDMGLTVDQMLDVAVQAGVLKSKTSEMAGAMASALKVAKEGAMEFGGGLMGKWVKEFEGVPRTYENYTNGVIASNGQILDAIKTLDGEKVKSWEKEKARLAEMAVANKKARFEENSIGQGEYEKNNDDIQKAMRDHYKTMLKDGDLYRMTQLAKLDETFNQEIAKLNKANEVKQMDDDVWLKKRLALTNKYEKDIKAILLDTYDVKALKSRMKEYVAAEKQALTESLRNIELAAAQDRKGEEDGTYEKQRLEATVSTLKDIEAEWIKHYNNLKKSGTSKTDLEAWNKKTLEATKALQKAELDAIKDLSKRRNKAEDKVIKFSKKRTDEIGKHRKKETELEQKAAADIVKINSKKNDDIAKLDEKRVDVTRDTEADIYDIHSTTEDKIADIRQKGMTEQQKESDNFSRARKKLIEGKKEMRDALDAGDLSKLETARGIIEDAGSKFGELTDDNKAVRGLLAVEKALVDAANAAKELELAELDKEQKKIEDTAKLKIAAITKVSVAALKKEDERHAKEMLNLDKELDKWGEKLKVAKELLDIAIQQTKGVATDTSGAVSSTGTITGTATINGKQYQELNGELVEVKENMDAATKSAAKHSSEIVKVGNTYSNVMATSVKETGDSITATLGRSTVTLTKFKDEVSGVGQSFETSKGQAVSYLNEIAAGARSLSAEVGAYEVTAENVGETVRWLGEGIDGLFDTNTDPVAKLDAAIKAYNQVSKAGTASADQLRKMKLKLDELGVAAGKPIELHIVNGSQFTTTIDEAGRKTTELYDILKASPLQFDNNNAVLKVLKDIPGLVKKVQNQINKGESLEFPVADVDGDAGLTKVVDMIQALRDKIESGEEVDIPLSIANIKEEWATAQDFIDQFPLAPPISVQQMVDKVGVEWQNLQAILEEDPAAVYTELDETSYNAVKSSLDDLSKDITVRVSTTQASAAGGPVGSPIHMATGGRLPGPDSKTDKVSVLARPGEWFIKNEAVKSWTDSVGPWFMNAVNSPMSAAGKTLMSLVGTAKSGKFTQPSPVVGGGSRTSSSSDNTMEEFGTVNFKLSPNEPAVPAMMKPSDAGELIKQLGKIGRLAA